VIRLLHRHPSTLLMHLAISLWWAAASCIIERNADHPHRDTLGAGHIASTIAASMPPRIAPIASQGSQPDRKADRLSIIDRRRRHWLFAPAAPILYRNDGGTNSEPSLEISE